MSAKLRLGLDLGTNSLGWALLRLDDAGKPAGIVDLGVRIFSDGRDAKSKASLAVDRRIARGARRRRDRSKQRQAALINQLVRMGLMPRDRSAQKALEALDPYRLRTEALNQALHPHHLGRAIFHLGSRAASSAIRFLNHSDVNSCCGNLPQA